MKPHHLISIILAVVIVGGLAWWASAYRAAQVSNPPPPAVNNLPTPPDQTANWNTYRNEEWGVEFKYPPKFVFLQEQEIDSPDLKLHVALGSKEWPIGSKEWPNIQEKDISYMGFFLETPITKSYEELKAKFTIPLTAPPDGLGRHAFSPNLLLKEFTIVGLPAILLENYDYRGYSQFVSIYGNGVAYLFTENRYAPEYAGKISSQRIENSVVEEVAKTLRFIQ